ncbi:MAG: FecR family protein [Candidatus Cryptobacteroides sp.]
MDKYLDLFIQSFRDELTEEDKIRLAKLLEDDGIAGKYEHYRKIWNQATAKGKSVTPESEKTWCRLDTGIRKSGRSRRMLRLVSAVASVSVVAAALAVILIFKRSDNYSFSEDLLTEAASAEWEVATSDKIVFRTSEGKYYSVDSRQAEISQKEDGSISINSVLLGSKPGNGYNRVRVPRGKMAHLNLADGTKVFLNALSEITFPSEFSGTQRMVYLSGEAYFNVARDEQRPFTALSDKMNVSVLGTKFNFSVSDETAVVTLVTGKVQVETDLSEPCVLLPNQQIAFQNGKLEEVRSVDVESVICWTSHKIICEDLKITDVFERLSQYFDRDFVCRDSLDDVSISGKLDLTESLDNLLETIAFVAPVSFTESDDAIVVTRVD